MACDRAHIVDDVCHGDGPSNLQGGIRRIRVLLGETGLDPLQQQVLERIVHSSGDPSLASLLQFSDGACDRGVTALRQGAAIVTDTAMAAAAVAPITRTLGSSVHCLLDWAPTQAPTGSTRSALRMSGTGRTGHNGAHRWC